MGTRTSIGLLALLLLVVLQHAVITAVPLRGPPSKTAKPGPVRGRGAGAASPSSPENHDQEEPDDETDNEMDEETLLKMWNECLNNDPAPGDGNRTCPPFEVEFALVFTKVMDAFIGLMLFPLDTIKTRLQAANSEQLVTSGKLFHGLYDGLGPVLVRVALLHGLEGARTRMHLPRRVRWTGYEIINFVIDLPFEVVKQRRQAGLDKTWWAAVSSLITSRGLTGFFMGWAAMALRDLPIHIATFLTNKMFEHQRSIEDKGMWPVCRGRRLDPIETTALFQFMIVCIAQVLTMPLDVVKTRLMTQSATGQYKGLLDCLLTIAKDEGLLALFRGIGPRFLINLVRWGPLHLIVDIVGGRDGEPPGVGLGGPDEPEASEDVTLLSKLLELLFYAARSG